jgi:tetratricopeptide (TPR) repeat protein
MRSPWLTACLLAFAVSLPASASAQGAAGGAKTCEAYSSWAAGEKRHDPNGVKGISPFWVALASGDHAYIARDFDCAISDYRDAIAKAPRNALGHYRMGEAQLAKGDMNEAQNDWQSALRFVGNDFVLKAKILFVLADLKERQRDFDGAIAGWNLYLTLCKEHPEAKGFPASAEDRIKVITQWKKLVVEYGAVKERIAKRLKEAEEKAKKNAR